MLKNFLTGSPQGTFGRKSLVDETSKTSDDGYWVTE